MPTAPEQCVSGVGVAVRWLAIELSGRQGLVAGKEQRLVGFPGGGRSVADGSVATNEWGFSVVVTGEERTTGLAGGGGRVVARWPAKKKGRGLSGAGGAAWRPMAVGCMEANGGGRQGNREDSGGGETSGGGRQGGREDSGGGETNSGGRQGGREDSGGRETSGDGR
ncbi:uncharacterized protein LOC131049084 [Cryptomeria japonica]|uniref:uncharacterized protein LOC131049084 n=1 Tax=Cryptomeria japonica TaxID=3369 RepID=UPI0027DA22C5|nr:uncharacterized protein LOC131049084 [Cryptomeria japonica]